MPETIDATPTWEGLLPLFLQIHSANAWDENNLKQFKAMARNADKLLILAVQAEICSKEFDDPVEAAQEFRRLGRILETIIINDQLRARITKEIKESF